MFAKVQTFLKSQSNASAAGLLVIIFLLAKLTGFDPVQFGKDASDYLVAAGSAWVALKFILLDSVTVAPNSVTVTPAPGEKVMASVHAAATAEIAATHEPAVAAPVVVVEAAPPNA